MRATASSLSFMPSLRYLLALLTQPFSLVNLPFSLEKGKQQGDIITWLNKVALPKTKEAKSKKQKQKKFKKGNFQLQSAFNLIPTPS